MGTKLLGCFVIVTKQSYISKDIRLTRNALILSSGRGLSRPGPAPVLDIGPLPGTCPRNEPALGQTYATVVFGERRVSGEQMLTVGRGLWTTATDQWRAFPASGPAAVIYVSDNCLGTQHSAVWPRRRVVLQRQTQIVRRYSTPPACTAQAATRRHFAIRSQRRARSARYKDGSSGRAASKDVESKARDRLRRCL